MKYYIKSLAILVFIVVSTITFVVESVIKTGCLCITTVIALLWMIVSPLLVNIRCPKWLTELVEYSFSWDYKILKKVMDAYHDSLDL